MNYGLFHWTTAEALLLKQIRAVKLPDFQLPGVDALNTTQVNPVFTRLINAVVERIYPTGFAEPVIDVPVTPLVQRKVPLTINQLKIFGRNIVTGHYRVFLDTDRAITLRRRGDGLALKLKFDCTAVTGALVVF